MKKKKRKKECAMKFLADWSVPHGQILIRSKDTGTEGPPLAVNIRKKTACCSRAKFMFTVFIYGCARNNPKLTLNVTHTQNTEPVYKSALI